MVELDCSLFLSLSRSVCESQELSHHNRTNSKVHWRLSTAEMSDCVLSVFPFFSHSFIFMFFSSIHCRRCFFPHVLSQNLLIQSIHCHLSFKSLNVSVCLRGTVSSHTVCPQVKYREKFDQDQKGQKHQYNPGDCLSFKHTQAASALASQVSV